MVPLHGVVDAWARLYQNSTTAQVAVQFSHIGGLVVGGGLAVASDRATLRLPAGDVERRERHVMDLHEVHGAVILALGVVVVSGILFFLADLDTYLVSPAFWIKMALVGLLLMNGGLLVRAERGVRQDPASDLHWQHLRRRAGTSLVLWLVIALAGTILVNAA